MKQPASPLIIALMAVLLSLYAGFKVRGSEAIRDETINNEKIKKTEKEFSSGVLLYEGHAPVIQAMVSLFFHPGQHKLELRKKDSHSTISTAFIPLPSTLNRIDSGVINRSGLPVICGQTQGHRGFVAGLDMTGRTLWRYPKEEPSIDDNRAIHYRFHSLTWELQQSSNGKFKYSQNHKQSENDTSGK